MYAILVMVFILSVYCINVISCTCGVIHGIASFDGRAIVWKNRDISGINQKIFFKTGPAYQYLAVGGTDTRMGLNTKGLAIGHSIVEDLRVSFINNVKNHDYILGNLCSLSQCTTVLGQQARGIAKYYDGTPSMTAPIVDGFGNAIYLEVGDKFNVVNENGDSV
ncbi:MAG: hypothetical protein JNL74_11165, partial [Fibrobacteres bacterium]|nr:hypothetical protein [Fibrobacterota bacterium]